MNRPIKIFVRHIFLLCLLGLSCTTLFAQDVSRFPYRVSFRGTTQPDGVVIPNTTTNSASFTADGLRLTDNTQQFGAIAIDGVQFNASNGIEIEFEYSMYEGQMYQGVYGDGISFFLYDASETLNIGARGAGLGYSYNRAVNGYSHLRAPGLNGAYLGVGFDEFGNFKDRRFQPESRVNGVFTNWSARNSHVTLRGAMHPSGLSGGGQRGLGYSGYPVLITQSTRHSSSGNSFGAILNATGGYDLLPSLGSANAFSLRPGSFATTEEDPDYRKATITLIPDLVDGFLVTVKIQHGTTTTTVIDNYHYKTAFMYTENANGNNSLTSTTEGYTRYETQHFLNAPIPNAFKIGFAGSTGAASQIQIIRDLEIRLPYMPEMGADESAMCENYNPSVTIQPFANDTVYNGHINAPPTGGNTDQYIDYSSFRFEDAEGNEIGGYSYTEPNVGEWTYNPSTGEVVFDPVKGYVGIATVNYSVKGHNTNGGPFGQDIYRSATTTIKVDVHNCNAVSNPNLPATSGQ